MISDHSALQRLKLIDVETLVLAFLLLFIGRLALIFSQDSLIVLVSIISAFSFVLLFGAKISVLLVKRLHFENSNLLAISLMPILGVGFIYLAWMTTASFSSSAPIVVFMATVLCMLLPPKLHVARGIKRAALSFGEIKRQKMIIGLIAVQVVLMILTANALADSGNQVWLLTIFDGLSLWVYASIFIVFGITILISLSESRLWGVSVFTLGLWARSFLFYRGFVHFGGDDGENIAVVKFLLNGGITPFLDLHGNEAYWNWRYGSFQTLNFHSNMAFVSSIVNLPLEFFVGLIAVVASSVFLIVGGYALSHAVLKNDKASRLGLLFILVFSTAAFWWQLRFDSNLFVSVLFPAYLAASLLLPNSKTGFSLFAFITFIMFSTHPLSLVLILPCVVYKVVLLLRRAISCYFIANARKNAKKIVIGVSVVVAATLVLLAIPNITFLILRLFSITHMLGLSPGQALTFGNYINQASLLTYYYPNYTLSFLFVLFGAIFLLPTWGIIKDSVSNKMKPLIAVSCMIVAELLVFDMFSSADPFPASRIWTVVPTIFAPIVASIFSPFLQSKNLLQIPKMAKILVPKDFLLKALTAFALASIITISFVQSAYPTPQALNLDTLTTQECNLLTTFASSVDLNQSLYLGEYPTMRYLSGIRGHWPATGNIISDVRVAAFVDLAYYGHVTNMLNLAAKLNSTAIYIIVLNRYSGPKVATWYGGLPYKADLKSAGRVAFSNEAGYILEVDL